jgi:hypothetical protein
MVNLHFLCHTKGEFEIDHGASSEREKAVVVTFTEPQSVYGYRFISHPIMPANVPICTHRDEPSSTLGKMDMEMGAAYRGALFVRAWLIAGKFSMTSVEASITYLTGCRRKIPGPESPSDSPPPMNREL